MDVTNKNTELLTEPVTNQSNSKSEYTRPNGFITAMPIKITAWILFAVTGVMSVLGVAAVVFMVYADFYISPLENVITTTYNRVFNAEIFEGADEIYRFIEFVYNNRINITVITVVSVIALIFLFVYLLWSAGRTRGEVGVRLCAIDRLPFDLFAGVISFVAFLFIGISVQIVEHGINPYYEFISYFYNEAIFTLAALLVASLLAMWILVSFSARVKADAAVRYGKWWKNTLIYYLCVLGWKIVKWAWGLVWSFIKWVFKGIGKMCGAFLWLCRKIPMFWKAVLIFGAYVILSAFLIVISFNGDGGLAVLLWIVLQIAAGAFVILAAWEAHLLIKVGDKMASGDLECRTDTRRMTGNFKRHGDNLNHIVDGMEAAVAERIKHERLRTELITNVSHDIKTPLTSVINYADLLSKEELNNDTAKSYVEVIMRQSQRLRKLTEDIVEASKASSGAIVPVLAPTDAAELLNQCAGEYSEKFAAAGIEPMLTLPDKPLIIRADGRLLWRVFDNLFGNVVKYSMTGTRVYISAVENENETVMTVRNISREPLNISADELTERFVRGDISRSTEGSGLGLSIAKSLTTLMGGELRITIDGDLFRAEVIFKEKNQ